MGYLTYISNSKLKNQFNSYMIVVTQGHCLKIKRLYSELHSNQIYLSIYLIFILWIEIKQFKVILSVSGAWWRPFSCFDLHSCILFEVGWSTGQWLVQVNFKSFSKRMLTRSIDVFLADSYVSMFHCQQLIQILFYKILGCAGFTMLES